MCVHVFLSKNFNENEIAVCLAYSVVAKKYRHEQKNTWCGCQASENNQWKLLLYVHIHRNLHVFVRDSYSTCVCEDEKTCVVVNLSFSS